MACRSKNWQDRRWKRKPDDTEALERIHTVIGDLPTYGYRRGGHCCAGNLNLTTWPLLMPNAYTE
ncbi:putative insD [Candidatus Erwinia dacicola]|uniref:InsD n=1 Tax=Candidatus Erwinia dacicola TaxID=252393 RepID=A0A328TRN9_9GAMM|nr:putative insD [Candidatus Erwinia dacicola]